MTETDWKRTPSGATACLQVSTYFGQCLRLFETGNSDAAEACLARNLWRQGVDLTAVPPQVLGYTEAYTSKARGLAEYGDPDAIGDVLLKIVGLWTPETKLSDA